MTEEAFRNALFELTPDPERIAADPSGSSWLPPTLREASRDPVCAAVLAEYVNFELDGFEPLPVADRTFAARVRQRAEAWLPPARRHLIRRTAILAAFHALALVVVVWWWQSGTWAGSEAGITASLRETAHAALADSRELASSLGWLTVAAVVFLVLRTPTSGRWLRS